ncbi:MAG TPA: MG2 domain-containing protein, partial [Chroococcales cyanobacterium]
MMTAAPTKETGRATSATLGGPLRFLTAISTDKPIYRGGDTVYIRGVVLNAATHEPLQAAQTSYATVQIKGPKGDVVTTGSASTENSLWSFSWSVPQEQAGGEYTASVSYPSDGWTPAERKFDVRTFRAPRLNSQIKFQRDGYGPGETVTATLDVKRAEGGVPQGAKVTVTGNVDGTEIKGANATVDARGLCTVSLALPAHIARGEGTLALIVEDGGVVETASKTIPILLQTIDLQIYPEGGDLVAGFKNRVYIQANQPNGKPADVTGSLIAKTANHTAVVAQVHTEHEGRGRFEFVPEAGHNYFLTLSKPSGIKKQFPLPQVKSHGAVLRVGKDVFAKGDPIAVSVGCADGDCTVTLSKREQELSAQKIHGSHLMQPVSFTPGRDTDGVLTVTVWGKDAAPLAERLVFREPSKTIKVTVTPDSQSYSPGEKVSLKIKTTGDGGKPVESVVGLTVTDESVLEMIEKREQAPQLPVMVFLEPEVSDLADAHVYLDPKNPRAPLATDLLLGTQ